ncbi:MAG: amidophosphoribosyltransferase [Candidatus Altiarchaeales archaeon]|nr:amidophosphoribosyltransferase [Candidatus Altiarchaeota archaeon]MBU4341656.1 amidophosphoribosyltransferase [Candidatus Altiarchaeota archaeon]MBU4406508.1 amidophosphoribosyltransferase [Candidatus Altiarchaeota archaeon]MBU4437841.1 amidophosphoribosyltransferase [Candidatus Altiarchaeota archaeon]MCG2783444.1 amidophosphoribosyltransferase [Candidatus Altiarchaeales archaeon]
MKPRHECAVFGIKSDSDVFDKIYFGLYSMQHRGQESAGIATFSDKIDVHREMGLVSEVFKGVYLEGKSGIGHVRYSTTGESGIENAQPLTINYAGGSFAIAHNGNLINSKELRDELEKKGSVFTTTTDTEIIAQLIVQEHLRSGDFMEGLKEAMKQLRGAYCLVILKDEEIIAIRDPWAVHPMVLGKSKDSYVVASESCALDTVDIPLVRDIKPGEILVIGDELKSYSIGTEKISRCMFEYVYFARADSVLDGINVYDVRKNLGRTLHKEAPVTADLTTAVPDSGITTAIGYSRESKIPYGESLMKNRYLGRTFIMPEQKEREVGVKLKLNPIKSEIKGKKIVLADDSIVRGTTVRNLINLLRTAGAKEVHVRISCPPVKHPCFYGIDMQTEEEFIASNKSVKDICKEIGADSLAYTSLEGLIKAIGIPKKNLCLACLTGDYPIKEEQTKLKVE